MNVVTWLVIGWILGRTWIPDELREISNISILQLVKDLPIPDETNVLSSEVHVLVPVRSMKKSPLILVQTRDCRPSPVVQDP